MNLAWLLPMVLMRPTEVGWAPTPNYVDDQRLMSYLIEQRILMAHLTRGYENSKEEND